MSGHVSIDDHACLYGNTFVETGNSGMIHIGRHAHIQPGCHIHAHLSRIIIGDYCEIAPNCSFYCYNHGFKFDTNIMDQPLTSRGDIRIGNGCWLGQNVVVLENVIIGSGAVIAASSVVTKDIPPMAIAAGCPARVIGSRS
jgi:acetyltransferase-like isoleucine patch superfamily enzyme